MSQGETKTDLGAGNEETFDYVCVWGGGKDQVRE